MKFASINWNHEYYLIAILYILYEKREDIILVFLCMGIYITTTVVGERLNILIFHDDIKCDTANRQMIYLFMFMLRKHVT